MVGTGATHDLWSVVQWQGVNDTWNDVDGWRGTFDPNNVVKWWVGYEDLGRGPFRWVVYQGETVLFISEPFQLPANNGEITRIGDTATSQFSLLPSTNPSGNFTKVTQRIQIEISIEQDKEWLRPGMMVEVAIEID